MINLKNLTLNRGEHELFKDATLTLHDKQKIAVVGRNGAGKSSFLALIQGKIFSHQGDIELPKGFKIACAEQEITDLDLSAIDYVLSGETEYARLSGLIKQAEAEENWAEAAKLYPEFEAIHGFTLPAKAAEILYGLGFSEPAQQAAVKSFSGGWRMRLNLAKALLPQAQILLLDEPSNHLDLSAILWLEKYLKKYQGLILFVSHDADFVNNLASDVLAIESQKLQLYHGSYDDYLREKALALELQEKTYLKQQKIRANVEKFIHRFRYKASKARQVQSRIKYLEKLGNIAIARSECQLEFDFAKEKTINGELLRLKKASITYAEDPIILDVNLSIYADARIGIVGLNGAGKSTLLKALAGLLPLYEGKRILTNQVKISYVSQHQLDTLPEENSALDYLKLNYDLIEKTARSILAQFDLDKTKVEKPISQLSGGEKMRLAFVKIYLEKPHMILLDEPTNHLDQASKDALLFGLQNYAGAIVIISHDREFMRCICDEIYLVKDGELQLFPGNHDDYVNNIAK